MIISNLDRKLTAAQVAAEERKEKRKDYIDTRIKKAEEDEREGTGAPDLILSGMQRTDVFTADPKIDNDPEYVRRMYSMRRPLPIKQREVAPDGTYSIVVAPEFVYAIAQGLWCHNCEEAQPDNDIEWMASSERLQQRIGSRPSWASKDTMCPFCGARLGFEGRSDEDNSLFSMTPEQRKLLEEMFGPIRA